MSNRCKDNFYSCPIYVSQKISRFCRHCKLGVCFNQEPTHLGMSLGLPNITDSEQGVFCDGLSISGVS